MIPVLDHIHGQTFHGRHGNIKNNFSYGVDYILTDMKIINGPILYSRNKKNLVSLYDNDYGSLSYPECGLDWVHKVLLEFGFNDLVNGKVLLLAQPRIFNHVFNPVSFWMIYDKSDNLRLVIAEVSNTFGDRHSYLCHHDDMSVIKKEQTLTARKVFHVSPFQEMSGEYKFRFNITDKFVDIWIDFRNKDKGVLATFSGFRQKLTNKSILKAVLLRPFGSIRVLALIHWQAIKLKFKGATFKKRPIPNSKDIS
ncbi:DUF1365 domain-containing protein [Amylibacter sp.]|nr:DUF1365 domain-containing protein [Amylibacter sp.]MDC3322558.1 DUF1365 domain-containing protein [Amylibacter sp.]